MTFDAIPDTDAQHSCGQAAFVRLGAVLARPSQVRCAPPIRRQQAEARKMAAARFETALWTTRTERLPVLVAHDSPIIAAGLLATLRGMQHIEATICRPGDTLDEALTDTRRPSVIFTDYRTAIDGASSAADGDAPASIWACVTSKDQPLDIREALDAGVSGYLLGDSHIDEYADCLRSLRAGARYVCPRAQERLSDEAPAVELTRRERSVLQLVVDGASNRSIAEDLGIALGTVKLHVGSILEKLGARSRTQAAALARAMRILEGASAL